MSKEINLKYRSELIGMLKSELMGPLVTSNAIETDCSVTPVKIPLDEVNRARIDKETGEEILGDNLPYGIGVLFPNDVKFKQENDQDSDNDVSQEFEDEDEDENEDDATYTDIQENIEHSELDATLLQDEDPDENLPTVYKKMLQSSMGLSFLIQDNDSGTLKVVIRGARYKPLLTEQMGREGRSRLRLKWLRKPLPLDQTTLSFDIPDIVDGQKTERELQIVEDSEEVFRLRVLIKSRLLESIGNIITVAIINETNPASHIYRQDYEQYGLRNVFANLYQSQLEIECVDGGGNALILPYPTKNDVLGQSSVNMYSEDIVHELESLDLLYRNNKDYAKGHGCAASWDESKIYDSNHIKSKEELRVSEIRGEMMPEYETQNVTPDIYDESGRNIVIRMIDLAGLTERSPADCLNELIDRYQMWIDTKTTLLGNLEDKYQHIARRHLENCQRSLERIKAGVALIKQDTIALDAFKKANHAMLLQQIAGRTQDRQIGFDKDNTIEIQGQAPEFDATIKKLQQASLENEPGEIGLWRPFQIAFIMSNLMGCIAKDPDDLEERKEVDLIWFPTGGGKTEAYLGLSAFTIFYRRLRNNDDIGIEVMMRYTLRLLTAQQFQRASSLICAMEYLRHYEYEAELGENSFSIGVWLGAASTPNTTAAAKTSLGLYRRESSGDNPFLLEICPWCRAKMGKVNDNEEKSRVIGYEEEGGTVILRCPDKYCYFGRDTNQLPVYVIDEDILNHKVDLVIATVDKFALLAWDYKYRSLFGLDNQGNRIVSPPGLIIQDELHLISGPLGSVVGLYEPLILDLCTDKRFDVPVPPKIVSSTATIRRYQQQIEGLYARAKVNLFPSPGIDAGDSFFAKYAIDTDTNELQPGKKYVGIYASSFQSQQFTEARVYAPLIQFPYESYDRDLTSEEKDPWWTLLCFYNSMRELSGAQTLFAADVRDYQSAMYGKGIYKATRDFIPEQLTGRQASSDVVKIMDNLHASKSDGQNSPRAIDVCQATNIIEVGVDIDRLSLMCVIGHPKTTAQYIQVTGRVGRRQDRPGAVVTIYKQNNPRNRSVFEAFQSYHSKLYAQVEPTSVTPAAFQAMELCLSAIMCAYVRNYGAEHRIQNPQDFDLREDLLSQLKHEFDIKLEFLKSKNSIRQIEIDRFNELFERKKKEWDSFNKTEWGTMNGAGNVANLMYQSGAFVDESIRAQSWSIPTSMRTVDRECFIKPTLQYALLSNLIDDEGNSDD